MKLPIYEYYEMLDRKAKKDFRLEVCRRCHIEAYQFYRRMKERCWSILEIQEIERIIDNNDYNNGESQLNLDTL